LADIKDNFVKGMCQGKKKLPLTCEESRYMS